VIIVFPGKDSASNSYLILEKKPALIDTGLGKGLLKEIGKHIPPEKIRFVINTHCHFDHIGGNGLFPKADILMHEKDAVAVKNEDSSVVLNGLFGGGICTRVTKTLSDGDSVDLGSGKLEVLHTPGHTAGSICLSFGKESALFTGDTLFSGCCGRTDLPTGSERDMGRSLKLISGLKYGKAYPGHGPSFTKGEADSTITASSALR